MIPSAPFPAAPERLRITAFGAVQGVGFRPFVYRLAMELGLSGWVTNSPRGVVIETEGPRDALDAFLTRLGREKPPRAILQGLEHVFLDPAGFQNFTIRESRDDGPPETFILPDIAACPDCLREMNNPADRRFLHPFTNCTNCGPRFTIITALPYDRPRTTMAGFAMCAACRREYETPADRRFHAQPTACPDCGPHLALWDTGGKTIVSRHEALLGAADAIRRGLIAAVKGLGGFHLVADARDDRAVKRLRERKHREEKPLALMCPDIASTKTLAIVSDLEERLLLSPEAPIVLLRRASNPAPVAPSVAPGNPRLGIMLPYTPLHHLLMCELGFPVVATSGNRSDEPIATDEREALERLGGIADVFLVHNRPIARHCDDSVVHVVAGREQVLRRARGYAPLPVTLDAALPPILAAGAHLKNTVALSSGRNVFVSQHIGDLDTPEALDAFRRVTVDIPGLLGVRPAAVAADLHPDYASTRHARTLGIPVIPVQHHHAHILSCMAENGLSGSALGVAWDGTGYGPDGTVWGGEFLIPAGAGFTRAGHLRTFPLPGGDAAAREPRRAALGLLYELHGEDAFEMTDIPTIAAFSPDERALLRTAIRNGINTPRTSSAGRLFDAVASLTGLSQRNAFEGQAAMALEFTAEETPAAPYAFTLTNAAPFQADWALMIHAILADVRAGVSPGMIAARFHATLAGIIVAAARRSGENRVALSGGCFQNRRLTELTVAQLREAGFRPYWHQRIPPNDGGIALGQVIIAAGQNNRDQGKC
ncbi:MAG: carbamoyltransferase HypF [Planctomycetota bacterium]